MSRNAPVTSPSLQPAAVAPPRRSLAGYSLAAAFSLMGGCQFLPPAHDSSVGSRPGESVEEEATPAKIPRRLAQEGVRLLEQGEFESAGRLFNAALKFAPDSGELNLLAGLVYHLEFNRGLPDSKDLAEVAYQLAIRQSPADARPLVQLGRLHLDTRQYELANDDFSRAVERDPSSTDAIMGLLQSSYLTGDLKTAFWANDLLERKGVGIEITGRAKAVLAAVGAGPAEYERTLQEYFDQSSLAEPAGRRLRERLKRLRELVEGAKWLHQESRPSASNSAAGLMMVADAAPGAESGSTSSTGPAAAMGTSQEPPTASPGVATPVVENAAPAPMAAVVPGGPRKKWFECAEAPQAPGQFGAVPGAFGQPGGFGGLPGFGAPVGGFQGFGMPGQQGGPSGDETMALPPLPAPCIGATMPRMAVIDAVLVRTEDTVSRSYGINLLQGLGVFMSYTRNTVNTNNDTPGSSSGTQAVITRAWGLSQPNAFLNYSLNIANAANNRNEVIARPSLVALDRMSSTFFSGASLTLGLSGQAGGASSIIDKQVGISLSVTPTFVDDEAMILAVKATRSFIQPGLTGAASSFNQQLTTSRNAVTANVSVRFGETLILSGLTEREVQRADTGVPLLKDIPLLQYLFKNSLNSDFNRTVLVMITPRKPVVTEEDMAMAAAERDRKGEGGKTKRYAFHWRLSEYEETLSRYAPNLDTVVLSLRNNQLYKNFTSRDLVDDTWMAKGAWRSLARDVLELLYH